MIFDGCIFDETIFDAAPCVVPPTTRGRATRWPIYVQPEADDEDEFMQVLLVL